MFRFTLLRGAAESIPYEEDTFNVVHASSVMEHVLDIEKSFSEIYRVLKPGGRFAVSDVVVRGPVPDEIRRNVELWIGCVAGALEESEFLSRLTDAGFQDPSIEPTRVYAADDMQHLAERAGVNADNLKDEVEGKFVSAFVRATKPAG